MSSKISIPGGNGRMGKTLIKEIIQNENLIVPHPRMSERNFVLFPLFEICNQWQHAKSKQKITNLMLNLPISSISGIKVL